MASDEVGADAEGRDAEETRKEDSSTDRDFSSSAQDDPSARTMKQAENFATELSSIQTARKRNLMTTSLSVCVILIY